MKKTMLLAICLLFSSLGFAQAPVKYAGAIGTYSIEVELYPSGSKEHSATGKYRYKGKTSYLDLKGDFLPGGAVYLEESYNGKVTGEFYLEKGDEGSLTGKWIGGEKYYETELMLESGDMTALYPESTEDLRESTSPGIEGSYASEFFFINDMWFREDNPQMEIGFNGGAIAVREVSEDTINVHFDLICGPTYHMAYYNGRAWKTGPNTYEAKFSEFDDEEGCHLIFVFTDRQMEIQQKSSSFACGFGARAYAEGTYDKVNDEAVEPDGEITVEDAKGK